jgi:hypothetical protein
MKKIPLTQGKFAIVDDEDFEWLNQWNWQARKYHYTFYAIRKTHRAIRPKVYQCRTILMHREIMRKHYGLFLTKKDDTDHQNRKGLDNRLSNLRVASHQENMRNRGLGCDSTSGHLGVSWRKQRKKWRAYITVSAKQIFLGNFDNKADAIKARKKAEKELFGEFARAI